VAQGLRKEIVLSLALAIAMIAAGVAFGML
jgi:hypothetical protein